ncbi:hypothetical protein [Zavarzinella formosa]|uniref:hypothetical protein n=1 Tax=Zavarzinella formosa TaxID=360055 RepID=UPI000312E57E|nr:hypothetical protein [Zavarzinella formosa]
MDACFCLFIVIMVFSIPSAIPWLLKLQAEHADAELMRKHPEAWRQKEMIKLEKERLEAEKSLAAERAKQENTRQNVGVGMAVGRLFGWW